jgi:hypothetical protein
MGENEGKLMQYETEANQERLLNDLTEAISGFFALDQAVSVLIEWGFIDADFGAQHILKIEKAL